MWSTANQAHPVMWQQRMNIRFFYTNPPPTPPPIRMQVSDPFSDWSKGEAFRVATEKEGGNRSHRDDRGGEQGKLPVIPTTHDAHCLWCPLPMMTAEDIRERGSCLWCPLPVMPAIDGVKAQDTTNRTWGVAVALFSVSPQKKLPPAATDPEIKKWI